MIKYLRWVHELIPAWCSTVHIMKIFVSRTHQQAAVSSPQVCGAEGLPLVVTVRYCDHDGHENYTATVISPQKMSYWLVFTQVLKYADSMLGQSSYSVRNAATCSQLMISRPGFFQDGCQRAGYITWDRHIAQDAPTSAFLLHSHNKCAGRRAGHCRGLIINEEKEGEREGPLESLSHTNTHKHTTSHRQAQFPWLIQITETCYRLQLLDRTLQNGKALHWCASAG